MSWTFHFLTHNLENSSYNHVALSNIGRAINMNQTHSELIVRGRKNTLTNSYATSETHGGVKNKLYNFYTTSIQPVFPRTS